MKKQAIKILSLASLFAVALLFAGCGGGGGGGAASSPSTRGNLNLMVDLPRVANSTYSYDGTVSILDYSTLASPTSVGSTTTSISWDSALGKYTGSFRVQSVPVGNNYISKVVVSYTYTAARAANSTTVLYYAGAIVDTVADGQTSQVTVSATSTAAALATMRYAQQNSLALNSASITSAIKTAIYQAVENLVATGTVNLSDFVSASATYFGGSDPFDMSTWTNNPTLTDALDGILDEADLGTSDTTAPTVSSFYVGTTAIASTATSTTSVPTEAPVFKVKFNESMDSTVDLNNTTTLTASGFSIALSNGTTGGTLTINSTNALNYGTFAWTTIVNTNDALTYTLNSSATLTANSLQTLDTGTTYSITSWTAPSNVKDAAGNAVSTSGISTTGSFTTTSDTTAPTVSSFYVNTTSISSTASTATGVPTEAPVFKIKFSESMDSSVDLNNSTTLSTAAFTIALASPTGGTLTINSSNALSYGTFAWATIVNTNDTLTYTLKSSATLSANSLQTLDTATTYNITSWTFASPGTLKDAANNAFASTAGISTTGSFTTQ